MVLETQREPVLHSSGSTEEMRASCLWVEEAGGGGKESVRACCSATGGTGVWPTSDRCRATASRERGTVSSRPSFRSPGQLLGGGGQDARGLSSDSLTKSGNACLPLGLCLVLAFWWPRNRNPLGLELEKACIL